MERKILSSFIVINLVLCLLAGFPVQAQNSNRPPASNPPKEQKKEVDEEAFPLYNGVSVSVDLWGIGSKAFGSDFLSSEVAVDVNLKNRFFPIVELGYGGTDAWNDNGTHYKSNAPYFRIGMNYNALFKKKFKNYLFVGLRYAMSSFKYDIATLSVDDPIYGGGIGNPNQVDDIWGGSLPFNFVSAFVHIYGKSSIWAGDCASNSAQVHLQESMEILGMYPDLANMAPTQWA